MKLIKEHSKTKKIEHLKPITQSFILIGVFGTEHDRASEHKDRLMEYTEMKAVKTYISMASEAQ